MWSSTNYNAATGPYMSADGGFTPCRCFVLSGSPPNPTLASAGADIDGVSGSVSGFNELGAPNGNCLYIACPGWPVLVEAGGSFVSGAILQSDGLGRAIVQSSGKGVLRALQAGSLGATVWAVFTSGR